MSYLDAIAEKSLSVEERAAKFLSSQAVMLSMAGVPGIYIHSLLGSGNWAEGVALTGMNRTINRAKLDYESLLREIEEKSSLRGRIFDGFAMMLKARKGHAAFHPSADQIIHTISCSVFALTRISDDGKEVLCLQSASYEKQSIELPERWNSHPILRNIIDDSHIRIEDGHIAMNPWDVLWLE